MKLLQSSLQSFGKKAGAAVAGVAASFAAIGVGMAVRGIVDFSRAAVDSASDITEATNAIEVAFGDAAGAIEKIGQTSAENLGLAKVEFFSAATQFSAFAKTIAGEGGDVAGVIEGITTRGSDFASVFNLEVNEALRLFQSGLAGETEPLRKFGIDLSAAAVEAYALEAGIVQVGETMTEQDKVLARYGTLLEQTEITAGDFANTSDSLANRQRILNASFEDLRGEVGQALLPAMEDLFAVAQEDLLPVLRTLGESAGPVLAGVLETIAEIAEEEVVPALEDFGNWLRSDEGVEAVEDFAQGLKDMTVGFGQLVGGVIDFATHPATAAVINFFAGIRDFFASAAFKTLFPTLGGQMRQAGEIAGFAREQYLNHANALYSSADAANTAAPAVEGLTIEYLQNSDSIRINNDLLISNATLQEAQQRHVQAQRMGRQHYNLTLQDQIKIVMEENRRLMEGLPRWTATTSAIESTTIATRDYTSAVSSGSSSVSSFSEQIVELSNTMADGVSASDDFLNLMNGIAEIEPSQGVGDMTRELQDMILELDRADKLLRKEGGLFEFMQGDAKVTAKFDEFGNLLESYTDPGETPARTVTGETIDINAVSKVFNSEYGSALADFAGSTQQVFDTLLGQTTLYNPETGMQRVTSGSDIAIKQALEEGFQIRESTFAGTADELLSAVEQIGNEVGVDVKLARGGIVQTPVRALVGEAGPEAVIPLSKMGSMGATYNIYVNASSRTGGAQAGEEVVAALKNYNSTNGDFNRQLTGFGA